MENGETGTIGHEKTVSHHRRRWRTCCVASPCPVWVRLLLFSPSLRPIAASSSATLASAD